MSFAASVALPCPSVGLRIVERNDRVSSDLAIYLAIQAGVIRRNLAAFCHVCERTVQNVLAKLRRLGLIPQNFAGGTAESCGGGTAESCGVPKGADGQICPDKTVQVGSPVVPPLSVSPPLLTSPHEHNSAREAVQWELFKPPAPRPKFIVPAKEEVFAAAEKRGIPRLEATIFWHTMQENDWHRGKHKVKRWERVLICWHLRGYLKARVDVKRS